VNFVLLALALTAFLLAADLDRDSLDDATEQALLDQFLPRFYLSKGECDLAPAEFDPRSAAPRVLARNGVIYGQAFPYPSPGGTRRVELHYHHLWARDCGRGGHPLDAEHVSALVSETAGQWRADYWLAAAHEGTVCDRGMARPSGVEARAEVWISARKHASFLSAAECNRGGCGGDSCLDPRTLTVPRVINLGQPGALMPGMQWAASAQWPLLTKMGSDFSPSLLARLDATEGLTPTAASLPGVHTTLAVGNKPVTALDTAAAKTGSALDASAAGTGNFLKRAARGVGRFLGGQ